MANEFDGIFLAYVENEDYKIIFDRPIELELGYYQNLIYLCWKDNAYRTQFPVVYSYDIRGAIKGLKKNVLAYYDKCKTTLNGQDDFDAILLNSIVINKKGGLTPEQERKFYEDIYKMGMVTGKYGDLE